MATSVTLAPAEASSFTNEAVAESVIRSTIRSNRAAIKSWLNSGATTNLRLEYNRVNNIGRGIMRSTGVVNDLSNARIILKANGNGNYFILTAFPQ
ncbi:RNase A-like domain-containing protein [Chryseobacterium sp. LAM-KRS1]|uniref:RNase A-like domain-containing protein n=1 Tax=Chryseobacterium sp. LAM-KRS1 TaxID=2715754 RepID=UPI001555A794